MTEEVLADAKTHMQKAIEATRREFAGLRAGRANPGLLEHLKVEYYGAPTPLQSLATITAPEPRLLVVKPFDKSATKDIERAILQSDLGFNPSFDGAIFRIPIPTLTEERRRDLVKIARKHAEEGRVSIRNIRRDAKEMLESLETDGEISEDESRRGVERLQELTDDMITHLDGLLHAKEQEIMEV
jgi:ribosome recycling factor